MPSVIVSEKMGITGVCKVFTKINTTGIALGAFDLLVAVMYPKDIRVKQMFDEAIEKYPLVKTLERHGFTPIPVRLRHSRVFDGGVHCATLDTVREESSENYFS